MGEGEEGQGGQIMVTEGDYTPSGEHPMQYTDAVL